MNSPWFPEMLYDVLGRVKPGEMVYLAHALLHTHTHTHSVTHPRPGSVGREKNLGERKNVYVCKSSLEGGRGGLYEWWSWLGKKKELSSADLFRFKFPPNTYTHRCCPARERARDGLLITIDFFFSFSSSLFSIFRRIYPSTCWPPPLYIYIYIPTCINILHIYSARFSL
jgi:hypothetical protein